MKVNEAVCYLRPHTTSPYRILSLLPPTCGPFQSQSVLNLCSEAKGLFRIKLSVFIIQPVHLSPLPSSLLTSLCSVCPGCSDVPDTPNLPTSGLLKTLLPYATMVMVIVLVGGWTHSTPCVNILLELTLTYQVASMNRELGRKAIEKLGIQQHTSASCRTVPAGHSSLLPHTEVLTRIVFHDSSYRSVILCFPLCSF